MSGSARLTLDGLTKQFGSTVVLDRVSLEVRRAQIHGLIGQNGAGKSTLVKCLAGLYPDHGGRVVVDGEQRALRTPRESRADGIAVIHQEFSLVPSMNVAENLLLGREPGRFRYDTRDVHRRAGQLLERVAIDVGARLSAPVSSLSPAVRQRIEIAKALADRAGVLVMDEPTARLSDTERGWLFSTMRSLSDEGVGIMFISHFLQEVREITDHLTVLRNGRVVGSGRTAGFDVSTMAELMLGDRLKEVLEREAHEVRPLRPARVVLSARGAAVAPRLRDINVSLVKGEILGVAGLVGSGRTRLARLLAGVDRPTSGTLAMSGLDVSLTSPRDAISRGIVLIPEDRTHQGLSLLSSVADNLCLTSLPQRSRRGFIRRTTVRDLARGLVKELQIAPARIDLPAKALSGGNQQKVMLGKALAARPQVLVIDQPTAGVDVGTKAQIHELLRERARSGTAVLVVSDDLDELYALSDRLCVMSRGTVLWQGRPDEMKRRDLLAMMSSENPDPAAQGTP